MEPCKYHKLNVQVRPIPESDYQKFPYVQQPQNIGGFSITSNRNYHHSLANLRYFVPPTADYPLDLNQGLQHAIKRPDDLWFEFLDHILHFIFENQEVLITATPSFGGGVFNSLNRDFVCTRDVLELILCTPYEHSRDWCLHATQYNNTIYICHQETLQEEKEKSEKMDLQKKILRSWDYKLQQICTRKKIEEVPNKNEIVDECEELNCVYEIVIEGMKILYNAEMSAVLPTNPETEFEKLQFVQIKTRLGNMNRNQWAVYKRNVALHWWCQSYLVDLETIHVGMSTENGLVQKIEPISVRSLRKETGDVWLATVCAHFLVRFMRALKEIFGELNDPTTVYEFCYDAMSSSIGYTVFEGRSDYTFIPDWYRLMMSAQNAPQNK